MSSTYRRKADFLRQNMLQRASSFTKGLVLGELIYMDIPKSGLKRGMVFHKSGLSSSVPLYFLAFLLVF